MLQMEGSNQNKTNARTAAMPVHWKQGPLQNVSPLEFVPIFEPQ